MKATNLIGKNIKGQTFSHELKPITLFCGENESGKTARAIAATLALIGYNLDLGKVAAKTFKLSSGSVMSSSLVFENGGSNRFTITKKGSSCSVATDFDFETPGILLNEKEYLDHKDGGKGRQRFLFDLAAKDIKFEITDLIADMKSIKLEPHPAEAETVINDLCESLEQTDQARVENNQPLDEWFAALVAKFEKKSSEATATAKTHRHSIQASVSNQALAGISAPQDQSSNIAANSDRSDKIKEAIDYIKGRLKEVQSQRDAREKAKKTLEENPAIEDKTGPLKAIVATLREAYEQVEATPIVEVAKLDLKQAHQRLKQREQLDEKLGGLKQSRASLEATIIQLENSAASTCDKCGSEHDHWNKAVVEAVQQDLANKRTSAMQVGIEIDKLEAARAELQLAIAEDVTVATNYRIKADAAIVENDKRNLAVSKASEQLFAARQALSKAEADLKINRALIANAQKQFDETAIPATDAELCKEFETVMPGMFHMFQLPVDGDVRHDYLSHLNAMLNINATEREQLDAKQAEYIKRQASDALREESKKSAEASELREKVLDAALDKMKARQTKVVTEGLVKFMEKASTLTQTVLGFSLEFREGDIGYFDGGQWVGYETFSGIQKALAMAGLRLSFAQEAPCKLLIIDELGTFSKKNKIKFLKKLMELIKKGFLDNFIGMDVSSNDYGQVFAESTDDDERNLLQLIEIEDKPKTAVKL